MMSSSPVSSTGIRSATRATARAAISHAGVSLGPARCSGLRTGRRRGKDVEATLVEKVKNGGSGVWGQIPMTPNPQVPDPDLHAIVKWILTLK
jgi:cytochrome c